MFHHRSESHCSWCRALPEAWGWNFCLCSRFSFAAQRRARMFYFHCPPQLDGECCRSNTCKCVFFSSLLHFWQNRFVLLYFQLSSFLNVSPEAGVWKSFAVFVLRTCAHKVCVLLLEERQKAWADVFLFFYFYDHLQLKMKVTHAWKATLIFMLS